MPPAGPSIGRWLEWPQRQWNAGELGRVETDDPNSFSGALPVFLRMFVSLSPAVNLHRYSIKGQWLRRRRLYWWAAAQDATGRVVGGAGVVDHWVLRRKSDDML